MQETRERGITLITLVITIIIMLILVGVTISIVINGGLFRQAENAVTAYEREMIRETILYDMLAYQIEGEGTITKAQVESILMEYGDVIYETDGTTIKAVNTYKDTQLNGNIYRNRYEILLHDIWGGEVIEETPPVTNPPGTPQVGWENGTATAANGTTAYLPLEIRNTSLNSTNTVRLAVSSAATRRNRL